MMKRNIPFKQPTYIGAFYFRRKLGQDNYQLRLWVHGQRMLSKAKTNPCVTIDRMAILA